MKVCGILKAMKEPYNVRITNTSFFSDWELGGSRKNRTFPLPSQKEILLTNVVRDRRHLIESKNLVECKWEGESKVHV